MSNNVAAVIKLGEERYMTELLHKGHVYMGPLSSFRRIDDGSPRFDPDEGAAYAHNVDGWSLDIDIKGHWQPLGTTIGALRASDPTLYDVNLYCLHVRTHRDLGRIIEFDKLGLGDAMVVFREPSEFMRRLDRAATAAGQKLKVGFVEYVDRKSYSGPMGLLRKFSEHEAEQELRIAALPGTGDPLSLWLGDLSDIALMLPTNKRVRLDPRPVR